MYLGISRSSLPTCQSLLSFLLGRLEKKEPHIKFKVCGRLALALCRVYIGGRGWSPTLPWKMGVQGNGSFSIMRCRGFYYCSICYGIDCLLFLIFHQVLHMMKYLVINGHSEFRSQLRRNADAVKQTVS